MSESKAKFSKSFCFCASKSKSSDDEIRSIDAAFVVRLCRSARNASSTHSGSLFSEGIATRCFFPEASLSHIPRSV